MERPSTAAFARGIALITVDLDDTLWPTDCVIEAAERSLYAWLLERAPRLVERHSVPAMREHRRALARQRPEIAHDLSALRLASLRQLLAECAYPRDWAEEALAVFLQARNRVQPFDDVAPVLEALARRYRLVSVTNGNAQVSSTPLGHCFELNLTAAEVGAAKPAPDLFLRALGHAAVGPEQALHVGDDPERDVDAARRVGMRTVWVNRGARTWPHGLCRPDLAVSDLHGLRSWLGVAHG
jgi:putative hydrolase of the HAD superfamily